MHQEAVDSGCHSLGHVEHWYCSVCGTFWTDAALTEITNSKNVIIPAKESNNLKHVAAKASTCKAEGNVEYWHCPDCEGFWLDAACTQVTNAKSVLLPKSTTHKIVVVKGKAATTSKTGLTDGKKCSVCGTWTVKQQTIAKIAKPGKSSISSLKAAKKQITVKFKKVKSIKGYEIQFATNSKMSKNKKTVTVSASSTKKVVKSLKAKTKYWVRIRTYKVVNGKKVYSDWSSKKTMKTK